MPNIWYCIPSARAAADATACLDKWRERGYKIAVMRQGEEILADHIVRVNRYYGWAASVNALAKLVLAADADAHWIVTGGDDYEPDPNHTADEIAAECAAHFAGSFGVMQPTGDRWGADEPWAIAKYPDAPAYIDRIAGSPWMGREWCERAYGGKGPLWAEHFHCWADEELQNVAIKLGVFWQRKDLCQRHNQVPRIGSTRLSAELEQATSLDYTNGRPLFQRRKAAGWPGSDPLP